MAASILRNKLNLFLFSCSTSFYCYAYAQPNSLSSYEWFEGSQYAEQSGVYGIQNMPSTSNIPGARMASTGSATASGSFFFFGGSGYDYRHNIGFMNDLWSFEPSTGNWTWLSGSKSRRGTAVYGTQSIAAPSNMPGSRCFSSSWTDANGNFWIFGGNGYASSAIQSGFLNDLWKYDPLSRQWTWFSGSNQLNQAGNYGAIGIASPLNTPSARQQANTLVDNAGRFWLYGGLGYDSSGAFGYLNDLWQYDPTTQQWTWVSGSQFANTQPVYGTQMVSSTSNIPGPRSANSAWFDSNGDFWIFGGNGIDSNGTTGPLNDLWKYTTSTGQWTWISGSNLSYQNGTYGTQGAYSPNNVPGSRYGQNVWKDNSGNVYLFGGYGLDATGIQGFLNDFWIYNPNLNQWNWSGGSSQANQSGFWGAQGSSSSSYATSSRVFSTSFQDLSGNLWILGGQGLDSVGAFGFLNDVWKVVP